MRKATICFLLIFVAAAWVSSAVAEDQKKDPPLSNIENKRKEMKKGVVQNLRSVKATGNTKNTSESSPSKETK